MSHATPPARHAAARSVLLLMDFQTGLAARLGNPAAIASAGHAAAAARAQGLPVWFTRVAFRPGYPEVAAHNPMFAAVHALGALMTQDHPATQVLPALAPQDDEPVILKRRVSAFSGSDLGVLLRAHGIGHLVLAGITTSGVVLSTLREAADLDYSLTVLADACADPDDETQRVLLHKIFPRQATVTSTEAWAQTL